MPFFQAGDELPGNAKFKRLAETALGGDLRGPAAMGVWLSAGCQVQHDCGSEANRTGDGVIERIELIRIWLNAQFVDEMAEILVNVKLWHAPGHDCDKCPPVEPGTWLFHDWFQFKYTPGKTVALKRDKTGELKDDTLIAAVWARDCIDPSNPWVGRCRYCGITVRKKDNRSDVRQPEMDHVDPSKAVGARNVVLSCRTCNKRKGARTPEQAGMTLLPQPEHSMHANDDAGSAGPASPRDDAGRPATGSSRRPTPATHGGVPRPADPTSSTLDATPSRELTGDELGPDRPAAPAVDLHAATRRVERPNNTSGPPPDHGPTTPDQTRNHGGRGVPGGRAPGQGQGQGSGVGKGTGLATGSAPSAAVRESPAQARRRRRRARKSRGRTQLIDQSTSETPESNSLPELDPHDAGAPPPNVLIVEGFGSPWFNHHGPPSTVGAETDCPDHHLPMPCWRCEREANT